MRGDGKKGDGSGRNVTKKCVVYRPFFTQTSGRDFLPDLCGEVHPETAPIQGLCCARKVLCRTEHFSRGEQVERPVEGPTRKKGRAKTGQYNVAECLMTLYDALWHLRLDECTRSQSSATPLQRHLAHLTHAGSVDGPTTTKTKAHWNPTSKTQLRKPSRNSIILNPWLPQWPQVSRNLFLSSWKQFPGENGH